MSMAYHFPKGGGAVRSVAVLTATGILSQLIGFGYRVLLTRLAGAEILGLYQLLLPVYAVLLSLTSVGLTQAVSNLSARYEVLGNRPSGIVPIQVAFDRICQMDSFLLEHYTSRVKEYR